MSGEGLVWELRNQRRRKDLIVLRRHSRPHVDEVRGEVLDSLDVEFATE